MFRFGIFAILGPFLGCLVFIMLGGGFESHAVEVFSLLLPFALVAGFLPAVITAGMERVIENCGIRRLERYLLTGLFGYAAACLLMLENLFEVTPMVPFEFRWGLIGTVPAVICSFIVDRIENSAGSVSDSEALSRRRSSLHSRQLLSTAAVVTLFILLWSIFVLPLR